MSLLQKLITLAKGAVDNAITALDAPAVASSPPESQPAQANPPATPAATPPTLPQKIVAQFAPAVKTPAPITDALNNAVKPNPHKLYQQLENLTWQDKPNPIFSTLLATQTAETAVYLLKAMTIARARELDKRRIDIHYWMEHQPALALQGLATITDNLDSAGAEARDHVRRLVRRYPQHASLFTAAIQPDGWLPEQPWLEKRPFTLANTPDWLARAIRASPTRPQPLPGWLTADNLPLLALGDHTLSDEQVMALLTAMRASKVNTPAPLIVALKEKLETAVLTRFTVRLLTWWNRYHTDWPATDWVLHSLVWWHTPALPQQITPILADIVQRKRNPNIEQDTALQIIKIWGQHNDTASLQALRTLESFARLGKIRNQLRDTLDDCLQKQKLDRSQFEDQLIVTLGLDSHSQRPFNYQGKTISIAIDADLTPRIQDTTDVWHYELPDTFRQGNTLTTRQITAYWDELQERLPQLLESQLWRLNRALVYERRWSWSDFSRLFFRHPIMRHVARSIIWGRYAFNGDVSHAFVLTEDYSAITADYDHIHVPKHGQFGLIHPIDLTPQQREAWQTLLSDYEIITIFDQLTRPVYQLTAEEKKRPFLTRFSGEGLPEAEDFLRQLHWKPVGAYNTYRRWFPYSNVSALLTIQKRVTRNGKSAPVFEALRFAQGRIETKRIVGRDHFWELQLPWLHPRAVRPRIISEALWNRAQLAGEAELNLE